MLNVLYDHQVFSWQKYGGISRYFCELMRHSNGLFNYQVGGIFRKNEYLKELNLTDEYPEQIKAQFGDNFNIHNNINRHDSITKAQNCDVFVPTYYEPYFLDNIKKPFVLTVHDFIHEIFPQLNLPAHLETLTMKKILIERANRIIAISENTKRDLLKFYPSIKEEKVSVVHHSTSWSNVSKAPAEKKQEKYILYTGARGTYKNFPNFLNAVSPLLKKYNLKLKCSGEPWDSEDKEYLKKINILERCSSEFANEQELQQLYANALCFVFPSLYEGFGIPILEAWTCDCPLVLSNASCFPEIAKDAGVYFDPYSVDDIRKQIEKVILSESLRNELVAKGKERLKEFSWRKAAEQSAKVYEDCYNENACILVGSSHTESLVSSCKICNSECENIFDSVILQKYNAHYFYCKNCGFLFCGNAQEWLEEAYRESINIEDTGIMLRNNSIASSLGLLFYYLFGNTGKFLDFAGGHGFLVRLMRDAGFDFYWADAYTQNLVARGFEGNLNEQYDAVTSFESFEHFLEPMQEIESLAKLSKVIVFSTDLLPSPIPKPNEWSYYAPSHGQHISFYSEKTLQTIASKHNLKYANILGLHIFCGDKIIEKIHSLNKILNDKNQLQTLLQQKSKMQSKTWSDHLAMAARKNKDFYPSPPILFIIFNRPDVTKRIFEAIRIAMPKRLYIAGDGARASKAGEAKLVMETRKIAEQIDWECEVKTLFQEKNLGCGKGVSTAINWFFENEEMGIILEDDCLPNQSFFRFCGELLEKYKDNDSIGIISGDNFQRGKKWGKNSYYFSDVINMWGWATWANRWKDFKLDVNELDETLIFSEIERRFPETPIAEHWKQTYYTMKEHKIDTWDYQFYFSQIAKKRIFIDPNVNLISNIGFGSDATHTLNTQDANANIPALTMEFPLSHPAEIAVKHNADRRFYGMEPSPVLLDNVSNKVLAFPSKEFKIPQLNDIFGKEHKFFEGRSSQMPDFYVYNLEGGFCIGNREEIWTSDGELVIDCTTQYKNPLENVAIPFEQFEQANKIKGTVFNLSLNGLENNYYHWITECLGRLAILKKVNIEPDFYMVSQETSFQKEWLQILGIEKEKIIAASSYLFSADNLILTTLINNAKSTYYVEDYFHSRKIWLPEFISDVYKKLQTTEEPTKNIYITRANAKYRKLVNENEIAEILLKYNYEIVDLDKISVAEQIKIFGAAKKIIGIHGAGLVNIYFSKPKCKLLEIYPNSYYDPSFRLQAITLGMDYSYIIGQEFGEGDPQKRDILLDKEILESALKIF